MRAPLPSIVKSTMIFFRCDSARLTLTQQIFLVVVGYLVVALCELLLHWMLGLQIFRSLRWFYLLRTANSGMALFPDLIFPACLLGWWNGSVGRGVSFGRAGALVLPLAVGVVGLFPIYAIQVEHELMWSSRDPISAGYSLVIGFFSTAMFVTFFTYGFHKSVWK